MFRNAAMPLGMISSLGVAPAGSGNNQPSDKQAPMVCTGGTPQAPADSTCADEQPWSSAATMRVWE